MAKRKVPPSPYSLIGAIGWEQVFNAQRLACDHEPLELAAKTAATLGFQYLAHRGTLYALASQPIALCASHRLNTGPIVVSSTPDRQQYQVDLTPAPRYVVCAFAWEYEKDGRFYYLHEDCPGWPRAVFADRNSADHAAEKLDAMHKASTEDLFCYFDRDDFEYDEANNGQGFIALPWPIWQRWLHDHDVLPPSCSAAEQGPNRDELIAWWTAGYGEELPWRSIKGTWTDAQRRLAAEHVNVQFFEVREVTNPEL